MYIYIYLYIYIYIYIYIYTYIIHIDVYTYILIYRDLDVAVLRRLEKRVLVPLPVAEAREQMLRKNLIGRASSDLNYEEVAIYIYIHIHICI
jgi:hypothetical protein